METAIIDYGAGNVFSVQQALQRLGAKSILTADPEVIRKADRVIFPGVGHARQAIGQLRSTGLDKLIPQLEQPVLGICLGMQLLCYSTEEGNVKGLGIFDTQVQAFEPDLLVPHMGWNDVEFSLSGVFPGTGTYYFVHSFRAGLCAQTIGTTGYGTSFSAVLKEKNFLGVQFHPEKSGLAGERLLTTFLNGLC